MVRVVMVVVVVNIIAMLGTGCVMRSVGASGRNKWHVLAAPPVPTAQALTGRLHARLAAEHAIAVPVGWMVMRLKVTVLRLAFLAAALGLQPGLDFFLVGVECLGGLRALIREFVSWCKNSQTQRGGEPEIAIIGRGER